MTGLFMACAGYAIVGTKALPPWIGWLAWTSAILCVVAIPSMYSTVVDPNSFYNVAGWGPVIIANVPPLIWFLVTSLVLSRKEDHLVRAQPIDTYDARTMCLRHMRGKCSLFDDLEAYP
jgi:hypothetical protein